MSGDGKLRHGKWQSSPGTFGFGSSQACAIWSVRARITSWRGIQVCQTNAGLRADFRVTGLFQPDDGRHAPGWSRSLLHEAPALAHHLQAVRSSYLRQAVSAVNSAERTAAVAWKLNEGHRSFSSSKATQLTRKIPGACAPSLSAPHPAR